MTHPLPFALAALLLSGFNAISVIILAVTLASRLFVPIQVERLPGGGKSSLWLSPLRDLMSFAVFVASFVPGAVSWRGRRYQRRLGRVRYADMKVANMRTLFLQAPSFDGFDGGAGARYQMKREVRSFWYPTWLAQPAALVEGSKLIDAPPHNLSFSRHRR